MKEYKPIIDGISWPILLERIARDAAKHPKEARILGDLRAGVIAETCRTALDYLGDREVKEILRRREENQ